MEVSRVCFSLYTLNQTLTDAVWQGIVSVVSPVNLCGIIALVVAAVDQLHSVVRVEGLAEGTLESNVGLVEYLGVPVLTANSCRDSEIWVGAVTNHR